MPESEFFEQLANNISEAKDIKLHCEKIYKYTLGENRYKTDKTEKLKLFDFLPYSEFKKVSKQRFWHRDDLLRNGYFSGLIGTNYDGILHYQANKQLYDLYDVDFNKAYPYCLKIPLPFGRFYDEAEWNELEVGFDSYVKFYQIKIKCIVNPFEIFVPPPPYIEYRDFDFLMQKNNSNMIVSEQRLSLIRQIYGNDTFIIKKTYYCPCKVYTSLAKFADDMDLLISNAKTDEDILLCTQLKIALNSLIGNFGRRDEAREIKKLSLIDSGVVKDVISITWKEPTYKEQPNYLPLAMVVNDITARRLVDLMLDENVVRICYNCDGGIVALKKGKKVITSNRIGRLKAKKLASAEFYSTSLLYNRPLVFDRITNKTYNTKSIEYNKSKDCFVYTEMMNLNTRKGFIQYENIFPVAVEEYEHFNFRQNEILVRLSGNKLYEKMKRVSRNTALENLMLRDALNSFNELCNPFDDLYYEIRRAPEKPEHIDYEQMNMFKEKFFK